MSKADSILDLVEQRCVQKGLRFTTKRKQVLRALLESGKALSAYDLIDLCKERYEASLPAMSVYRILEFLEEHHFVHKLHIANKYVACSHLSCDHAHQVPQFLICQRCDAVEEIGIQKALMDELEKNVDKSGFHLVSPQFELNCICNNCIAEMAKEAS